MPALEPVVIDNYSDFQVRLHVEIMMHGPHCSLNHWDISRLDETNALFRETKFDGDISQWDVGHIENMSYMFDGSEFTGHHGSLAGGDVSNVTSMEGMFYRSKFGGDISAWKISPYLPARSMSLMTTNCDKEALKTLRLPVFPHSIGHCFQHDLPNLHLWLAGQTQQGHIAHHWDAMLNGLHDARWATPEMVAFCGGMRPVLEGLGLDHAHMIPMLQERWAQRKTNAPTCPLPMLD